MKEILNIDYKKHVLSNGLEVILHKDNSLPLVAVNLWYKVGSANEVQGKTGFAHLFEHMMFQGSQNVPKEMHFKYIQEAGGSLNGSTSNDRTNYYETVPSNFLEMALWLESDRMGFLLPALTEEKLNNQKDVVMNERRQSYENRPYGLSWEIIFSNLYPENHPYHWPTIGWMKDIENYELDDVKNFFKKYYAPNNASIVIAGDIEYNSSLKLVEKYFGEIPAGDLVKKPTPEKQELNETRKIVHEDNVELSRLYLVWNSESLYGKDDAALDVLADILFGSKNSRLIKSLVFEKQIAHEVSGFQYSAHLNGSFLIIATAKPETELNEIKEVIFSEINKLVNDGITDEELARSKNSNKSSFIYSLQNLSTKADLMNNYNTYLNEPNSFHYDYERINNLKSEDIINAAKKYLLKNYVELNIIPKGK
ncbi:MAG: insulinase family protein [Bacteroidetes bacterium]|nr:insulinase family protein [Bacteroidota bacterium]